MEAGYHAAVVGIGGPHLRLRIRRSRVVGSEVGSFEEHPLTSFTPPGEEKATTYFEFIAGQARRLRELLTGRGEYVPLRIHA